MRAGSHAIMCQLLTVLSFTVAPLLLCSLSDSLAPTLIFFAVLALLWFGLLYWVPVRCETLTCNGRMRRSLQRVSFFKQKVTYECSECRHIREAEILYPDITFEVGG